MWKCGIKNYKSVFPLEEQLIKILWLKSIQIFPQYLNLLFHEWNYNENIWQNRMKLFLLISISMFLSLFYFDIHWSLFVTIHNYRHFFYKDYSRYILVLFCVILWLYDSYFCLHHVIFQVCHTAFIYFSPRINFICFWLVRIYFSR